uniref:Uncharacterized protein LOC114347666 n=1 Tax=Diabrotica virgifera virgifera TaxID=50390 RepID=A0A6P7H8Y8_DIAVI
MSESPSKQYFLAALNLGYKNEYEFENGTDCFHFIEREFGLNPFQKNSIEINEGYTATSNNKQNFFDYQNQSDFTSAKDDGVSQKIYHNFEFVCCDQYVENTEISKGYIVDTSKENWSDYPNHIYLIELEYNYTPEDKDNVSESVCRENILDYSIKIENNYNPQVKDNISESKCKENMSDYPIKIEYSYIPQYKDNTSESVCRETKLEYPIKIENNNNYIVHHKDNISESLCKEDMSDCPLKIKNNCNPEDKENISQNVASLQYPKSWTDNFTDYKKNDANNNEIIFKSSKKEQIQMKKNDRQIQIKKNEKQIQIKKTDEEQIQITKTDEEQIQMKENDGQIQMKHDEYKRLKLTCDICNKGRYWLHI